MDKHETADRCVRNHRTALRKPDAQLLRLRQNVQDIPFQSVVRTAEISRSRFHDFEFTLSPRMQMLLQMFVQPDGSGFCQCDAHCPVKHRFETAACATSCVTGLYACSESAHRPVTLFRHEIRQRKFHRTSVHALAGLFLSHHRENHIDLIPAGTIFRVNVISLPSRKH